MVSMWQSMGHGVYVAEHGAWCLGGRDHLWKRDENKGVVLVLLSTGPRVVFDNTSSCGMFHGSHLSTAQVHPQSYPVITTKHTLQEHC
ncbi:hypothetical protein LSAT2_013880 [Lamellibrachia satsuma]|nr:hypothetical protein LSAT2_013880 [Lamellibrachia satsuma]